MRNATATDIGVTIDNSEFSGHGDTKVRMNSFASLLTRESEFQSRRSSMNCAIFFVNISAGSWGISLFSGLVFDEVDAVDAMTTAVSGSDDATVALESMLKEMVTMVLSCSDEVESRE